MTATPKRNSATMPLAPTRKASGSERDHVRPLEARRVDALADEQRARRQAGRRFQAARASFIAAIYAAGGRR